MRPYFSSLIQTILSAAEFHRIGSLQEFAGLTAGRESHPAPKTHSLFGIYYMLSSFSCQSRYLTWIPFLFNIRKYLI